MRGGASPVLPSPLLREPRSAPREAAKEAAWETVGVKVWATGPWLDQGATGLVRAQLAHYCALALARTWTWWTSSTAARASPSRSDRPSGRDTIWATAEQAITQMRPSRHAGRRRTARLTHPLSRSAQLANSALRVGPEHRQSGLQLPRRSVQPSHAKAELPGQEGAPGALVAEGTVLDRSEEERALIDPVRKRDELWQQQRRQWRGAGSKDGRPGS